MNKKDKIAVIGLGFVGLPLSIHFANKGYEVYGFDLDSNKIQHLNNGISYIQDIHNSELKKALDNGYQAFIPSEKIQEVQYIVVAVPTPFNDELMEPDISAIKQSSEFIAKHLSPQQTVIVESSTYPGTLEEIVLPILSNTGLKVGQDFYLGYSPERIDPGNKNFTIEQIPKVVSGQTKACQKKVMEFYGNFFEKIVPVSSPKVAEMTKLFENTQRLVNISLVNEVDRICSKMGIDFREAIHAASTKPFGFTPYYPGPGIGGHCIPVDPLYFQWKAAKSGHSSELIKAAYAINKAMPMEIIQTIKEKLDSTINKNKSILLVGLTYKKDVNDLRESPALVIYQELLKENINVSYHDPLIPQVTINNHTYTSLPLTIELIKKTDITVILTDHSTINWESLKDNANFIIDTRGITTPSVAGKGV